MLNYQQKETSIVLQPIKPHQALDGKTPSEQAGITVEGDNKWLSLMRNAIQFQKSKCKTKY